MLSRKLRNRKQTSTDLSIQGDLSMFIIGLIASLPYVGPPTVQKHPNTRYLHCSSFAPFLDVAALMDLLYISRSSAVRPTLQTLAPIQSSTSFSQDLFGLPLLLWPFIFLLVLIYSMFCVFLCVKNNLIFAF